MSITSAWLPGSEWPTIQQPWLALVEASPVATAFQSPAWIGSLIDYRMVTGDCGFVVVKNGADIVGVVPLYLRRGGGQLSRILLLGGDYCDVIAAPGFEADVVRTFSAWVGDKRNLTELADFRSLHADGVLFQHREHLESAGWTQNHMDHQPYPAIALPPIYADYEAKLGKGLRRDLKQIPRRLEREHPPFVIRLGTASDMPEFYRLHQLRWVEKGLGGVFETDAPRLLHTRLAAEVGSGLRLWIAEANGHPIGALYGFSHGKCVIEYLSGFDPAYASLSPVKVLRASAIEHAIGEGCKWYDFAKGEEDYKLRWMAVDRMTKRIVFGRGPRARFVASALRIHPHLKALKRRLKGS